MSLSCYNVNRPSVAARCCVDSCKPPCERCLMAHAAVYRFEHLNVPSLKELANGRRDGEWWACQEDDQPVAYLRHSLKLPRHYCRSCDVPVRCHESVLLEHHRPAQQITDDRETTTRQAESLSHTVHHTPGVEPLCRTPGVEPAARAADKPSQCELPDEEKSRTPQHAVGATKRRWVFSNATNHFRKALVGILGQKVRDSTDRASHTVEPPTDASIGARPEGQCSYGAVDGSRSEVFPSHCGAA